MAPEIDIETPADFLRAIVTASGHIAPEYFSLPVAGLDYKINRERVYCYELYHQLRKELRQPRHTLTAEPDKRGHPDFRSGVKPNPDFIFHVPGGHKQNAAVVEVECKPTFKHLVKDLKTLRLMKSKGYEQLILLLFGTFEFPNEQLRYASLEAKISLENIVVLFHESAGSQAVRIFVQ